MKTKLIKAFTLTILAGGGLLAASPAQAETRGPDVEAIVGDFVSGDRVHAVLIVADPTPGTITLELEGYTPADRKFHSTRVGARVFIISAGRTTYNGYFQSVSRGITRADFTRFRIAIKSWTVDNLGGWTLVSNTFTRPVSRSGPGPSPSSGPEDDSRPAATGTAPSLTDATGLISADAWPVDGAGAPADGSPDAADNSNAPPSMPVQSGSVQHPDAPVANGARQLASAKVLATPGWATGGGWILLLLVPVIAGGAMFAAFARG